MSDREKKVGKHGASTPGQDEFWRSIEDRLAVADASFIPTTILSPRQSREYKLALAGVPKFLSIFEKIKYGRTLIYVPKDMFEKFFVSWAEFDLLSTENLEPRFLSQIQVPAFMPQRRSYGAIISELTDLVSRRVLSARFEELWWQFNKFWFAMAFIEAFSPYEAFGKSVERNAAAPASGLKGKGESKTPGEPVAENTTVPQKKPALNERIVEKYVYVLWLSANGWSPSTRNKGDLQSLLAQKIAGILLDGLDRNKEGCWYSENLPFLMKQKEEEKSENVKATTVDPDEEEDRRANLAAANFHLTNEINNKSIFTRRSKIIRKKNAAKPGKPEEKPIGEAKLNRALTNMTDDEIFEYQADGFFDISDFPLIFSPP